MFAALDNSCILFCNNLTCLFCMLNYRITWDRLPEWGGLLSFIGTLALLRSWIFFKES